MNYRGTRAVCEAVQPLLTQNARIVNVSSRAGLLKLLPSDSLRQRFDGVKSVQEVDVLADEFVEAIKSNRYMDWVSCCLGECLACCSIVGTVRILLRHLPASLYSGLHALVLLV